MKRGQSTKTNVANMKRFARRNGFEDPLSLPINVLVEMYKMEKQRTKRMLADSAWMKTEYPNAKLQVVIDAEKDEDATRLEILIKNERQQKIWRGIRYVTSPNCAGGVTKVIIPREDGMEG